MIVWIEWKINLINANYRGDFDFGGVNFGNSKSNCDTLRLPLAANRFGVVVAVVNDCCALLLCMVLLLVAFTVIGDRDDGILLLLLPLLPLLLSVFMVGSLFSDTVDWLQLFPVDRGVGGGDVDSCIAWLRVRNFPFPLF